MHTTIGKCDLCGFMAEVQEAHFRYILNREEPDTTTFSQTFNRCVDREQCRLNALEASKGIVLGGVEAPER